MPLLILAEGQNNQVIDFNLNSGKKIVAQIQFFNDLHPQYVSYSGVMKENIFLHIIELKDNFSTYDLVNIKKKLFRTQNDILLINTNKLYSVIILPEQINCILPLGRNSSFQIVINNQLVGLQNFSSISVQHNLPIKTCSFVQLTIRR